MGRREAALRKSGYGRLAMPTMATFMQFLPGRFRGKTYRSTDSTVYCAVEGTGKVRIGDESFTFDPHDVFVVPSWRPVQLEADSDAVLFSYSDRPVLSALNLLREERIG